MNSCDIKLGRRSHQMSDRVDRGTEQKGRSAAEVTFQPGQQKRAKKSFLDDRDDDRGQEILWHQTPDAGRTLVGMRAHHYGDVNQHRDGDHRDEKTSCRATQVSYRMMEADAQESD